MDDETRARVEALLSKTIAELTVGEAIYLALVLDQDVDDDAMRSLVGLPPASS